MINVSVLVLSKLCLLIKALDDDNDDVNVDGDVYIYAVITSLLWRAIRK